MDIDWNIIAGIVGTVFGVGGISGWIKARSDAGKTNLDGCLEIIEDLRVRVVSLEKTNQSLNDRLFAIQTEQSKEVQDYIKDVSKFQVQVSDLQSKLDDSEAKIIELTSKLREQSEHSASEIKELTGYLRDATKEIDCLKKKLAEYEDMVKRE